MTLLQQCRNVFYDMVTTLLLATLIYAIWEHVIFKVEAFVLI